MGSQSVVGFQFSSSITHQLEIYWLVLPSKHYTTCVKSLDWKSSSLHYYPILGAWLLPLELLRMVASSSSSKFLKSHSSAAGNLAGNAGQEILQLMSIRDGAKWLLLRCCLIYYDYKLMGLLSSVLEDLWHF